MTRLLGLTICLASIFAGAASLPDTKLPLPIIRQATNYSCGAAALLSVLMYWKASDGDSESNLYKPLGTTPQDGTRPGAIVALAEKRGLGAKIVQELQYSDLEKALSQGMTPIVDFQAWKEEDPTPWEEAWEHGHYAVLIALDSHNLYFMDPSVGTSYSYVPRDEMDQRWHDYETLPNGEKQIYRRMAIFIKGSKPISQFPSVLVKTE